MVQVTLSRNNNISPIVVNFTTNTCRQNLLFLLSSWQHLLVLSPIFTSSSTDSDIVASSEQRIRHNTSLLQETQMTSTSHGSSKVEPESLITNQEDVDYESLPTTSVKVQLLAGAIAGIAEHTIVYPIDAIKVRIPTMDMANL